MPSRVDCAVFLCGAQWHKEACHRAYLTFDLYNLMLSMLFLSLHVSLCLCCRMEALGGGGVPWRPTSRWRNSARGGWKPLFESCSWLLSGHFGRFLKRTVPSPCAWFLCAHTRTHTYAKGHKCVCVCVWESCTAFSPLPFMGRHGMLHQFSQE